MKNKLLRTLAAVLSVTTIASTSFPSLAYELDENGNSIEEIEYQNDKDEDFENSTNVFAELKSEYKVTIPKVVVLSGASKDARYYVKVEGDIAGYETVHVEPEDSFNLYAVNKDAVVATIDQDKTSWHVADFDTDATGVINASDITAGNWQGTFNFNVFLKDSSPITLSSTSGKITDEDFLNFTITSFKNGDSYTLSSSDSNIATASLSKNVVKVTARKEGIATITVTRNETPNNKAVSATFKVDVGHKYVNGVCTRCEQTNIDILSAGMYDNNFNLVKTWEELEQIGAVHVDNGMLYTGEILEPGKSGTSYFENTNKNLLSGILIIPDTVTDISANCFTGLYNLNGIILSNTVENIGHNAFYGVTNMHINNIFVKSGNKHFKTVDGILYNIDMTELIRYPHDKANTIFTVPKSVKRIGTSSFSCNGHLTQVILPENLEEIGESAFESCSRLTNVEFPNSLKIIEDWAFCATKLNRIDLENTQLKSIGWGAFRQCTAPSIFIPKSVDYIGGDYHNQLRTYLGFTNCNAMIYVEAETAPETWSPYWNYRESNSPNNSAVKYNISKEDYINNYRR